MTLNSQGSKQVSGISKRLIPPLDGLTYLDHKKESRKPEGKVQTPNQ